MTSPSPTPSQPLRVHSRCQSQMANFGDHSISSAPANSKQEAGTPKKPLTSRRTTHDTRHCFAIRTPQASAQHSLSNTSRIRCAGLRRPDFASARVRRAVFLESCSNAARTFCQSDESRQCEASESPVCGMQSRVLPPSVSRDSSRLAVVLSDRKLQASHTRTRRDVRPLREPAGRQEPSPHLPGRIIRSGARTRCRLPSYLTMIPQTSLVSTYQQMGHGPSSHLSSM